jgi:hypothetical protein
MSLKLWVSTSEGDDMDLFVLLRMLDGADREVHFYGYNGFERDSVAKGWLRVSHRALDPARSRPSRPWLTHRERQPLTPGQVVPSRSRSYRRARSSRPAASSSSMCSDTTRPAIQRSSTRT